MFLINKNLSTYIVSDIHGHNKTFRNGLKNLRLKKHDHLIILGDLIDRGPSSKEVLDTIFLLLDSGFKITTILGNHEQMMLNAFENSDENLLWLKNGGKKTLSSFLTSDLKKIPVKYLDYLRELKPYLELDNYLLVHAGINMKVDNPLEDIHSLLWMRNWTEFYDQNWISNRTIIHGHTPMQSDLIKNQFSSDNTVICIDNGCYLEREGYGSLCFLRLDDLALHFEKVIQE